MEQFKTVIDMLKKINARSSSVFDSCKEEKLRQDIDYENLFQEYWASDLRLKNAILLLEAVEKEIAAVKV